MAIKDKNILEKLDQLLEGEVVFDKQSQIQYSTGACIYKILPAGIVYPKNTRDVIKTVRFAKKQQISITARGGGTSRTGAPLNSGLILDFSRYMNQLIEINAEKSYAVVQPGIVLSTLNDLIKDTGKFYAVDPTSLKMCTIGGVVANNSAGERSIKYGNAKDNVLACKLVLASGDLIEVDHNGIPTNEIETSQNNGHPFNSICSQVVQTLRENSEKIRNSRPNSINNNDGYNIWDTPGDDDNTLNLLNLFVGSEGTLGLLTEVKVKLHDIPRYQAVVTIAFSNLADMDEAMPEICQLKPSAVEIMDQAYIELRKEYTPELVDWVSDEANAILLIEFHEQDQAQIKEKLSKLKVVIKNRLKTQNMQISQDKEGCDRLWLVRKNTQRLKNIRRLPERATAFVEDSAFAPYRIGEIMVEMSKMWKKHNLDVIMNGHAALGNIHIYPLLNLKTEKGVHKLEIVMKEFEQFVQRYNGCISAEHGIGIVRTDSVKRLYQDTVFPIFMEIKKIFDPGNLLNPGKIVSSENVLTENLRYGTGFNFVQTYGFLDQENILKEVDWCHGCGKCRGFCLIFKNTPREEHTPRGVLNVLREIKAGTLSLKQAIQPGNLQEFSRLCLNCKICAVDCFDRIDVGHIIARLKEEIIRYHGQSLGDRFLSNPALIGKMGSLTSNISNRTLANPKIREWLEKIVGIDRNRKLPHFSGGTLKAKVKSDRKPASSKVVFFSGCFYNYNDQDEGAVIINFLKSLGCEVALPSLKCCGIPQLVNGNKDAALECMTYNVRILSAMISQGYEVISECPTCAYSLKEEYTKLADESALSHQVNTVAEHSYELHEYLLKLKSAKLRKLSLKKEKIRVAYHSPCHLRALKQEKAPLKILALIPGVTVVAEHNECCGMGGTWGMKHRNYSTSKGISQPIANRFNPLDVDFVITSCSMCQLQLSDDTSAPVVHPINLLNQLIEM